MTTLPTKSKSRRATHPSLFQGSLHRAQPAEGPAGKRHHSLPGRDPGLLLGDQSLSRRLSWGRVYRRAWGLSGQGQPPTDSGRPPGVPRSLPGPQLPSLCDRVRADSSERKADLGAVCPFPELLLGTWRAACLLCLPREAENKAPNHPALSITERELKARGERTQAPPLCGPGQARTLSEPLYPSVKWAHRDTLKDPRSRNPRLERPMRERHPLL